MKKLIITLTGLTTFAGSATAAIRCNEEYQVVNGNEIATPYCGDNNLAEVARHYGIRVSNAEIRNNTARKGEVCRMIGHDIRVKSACAGYNSDRGGSGR